ncbi:MAG TPA: nucleoside triphosphate pyrophosphohydrolase [Candidatus Saccharimonadales bacterium]|nr:nucleoside triphosphate pyrophosphohydrolase [Candidatus Saccharimonadales bacterium]
MNRRTFKFGESGKLVRDGIVSDLRAQGGEARHEILTGTQKTKALLDKLIAEAEELRDAYIETGRLSLAETIDVREVVSQIETEAGFGQQTLEDAQRAKRERIGGLAGGWYVHSVSFPSDNPEVATYAADPKKFPEVK